MHPQKPYALALVGTLALALLSGPADAQVRFSDAPAQAVRSSLSGIDINEANTNGLSRALRTTAQDLGECQGVRRMLERAISDARASDDVHEDWIHLHEECVNQREEDLSEIAQRADDIRQDTGDTNTLVKLREQLLALDNVLRDAQIAHDALTNAYQKTQEFADLE